MADVIEQLKQLGFSQYEAQAYITLLQRSPQSGYELARSSGIPRPNIYTVLQKLEERGSVVRVEAPEGVRYAPVASEELIRRLSSQFEASLESARCSLRSIATHGEEEHIWNARGYSALLDHARAFIQAAEEELILAVWPQEAQALSSDIHSAEGRGVEVTTLCLAGCPQECGSCAGRIHRYTVPPQTQSRWLVLVPDGREVLAGEVQASGEALAVRTRQRLLVELASWYIRHSIALAALVNDIGMEFETILQPETRAILEAVGPGGTDGGWLEHLSRLLKR